MKKLSEKDFKNIFLVILASIPIGFINYFVLSGLINQRSSKPALNGGYVGDGDMSYCKNLNDRISVIYCESEHQENILRSQPLLLQFICFGLFPIGYIAAHLFFDEF